MTFSLVIEVLARIHNGMPLKEAERCGSALGACVTVPHRTGERRFVHPLMPKRITQHYGHDAVRPLVTWLRRLAMLLLQSLGG